MNCCPYRQKRHCRNTSRYCHRNVRRDVAAAGRCLGRVSHTLWLGSSKSPLLCSVWWVTEGIVDVILVHVSYCRLVHLWCPQLSPDAAKNNSYRIKQLKIFSWTAFIWCIKKKTNIHLFSRITQKFGLMILNEL